MYIIGRVENINKDVAYVTLFYPVTGERLESRCSSSILLEKGISKGNEFKVDFVEKEGKLVAEISFLPPKEVSKEDMDEILNIGKDWNF